MKRRNALNACRSARNVLLTLCVSMAFDSTAYAADPTLPTKPTPLSDAERKPLLADRDRFDKESATLETQGNYANAVAAAEKMLGIERRVFGDVADDVAGFFGTHRPLPTCER